MYFGCFDWSPKSTISKVPLEFEIRPITVVYRCYILQICPLSDIAVIMLSSTDEHIADSVQFIAVGASLRGKVR
jgi:hypothetical protein